MVIFVFFLWLECEVRQILGEKKPTARVGFLCLFIIKRKIMVEGDGFEPSKAEPADLQSAPFGHSGTPPQVWSA